MAPTPIAARVPAHRVCHPAEALPILVVTKNQAHDHRVLICDRDAKWSAPVRARLGEAGDPRGADAVSGAQRECLRGALRALDQARVSQSGHSVWGTSSAEYVEHYHRERNHQGLENELIEGVRAVERVGRIRRRQRLGGLLNYYCRAA